MARKGGGANSLLSVTKQPTYYMLRRHGALLRSYMQHVSVEAYSCSADRAILMASIHSQGQTDIWGRHGEGFLISYLLYLDLYTRSSKNISLQSFVKFPSVLS